MGKSIGCPIKQLGAILGRLFRKRTDNQPGSGAGPASPTSAVVREDESPEDLYQEFCRTSCHRPGVSFMEFLRDEGGTRMIDWLRPDSACDISRGLIRLLVDTTRKGSHLRDTPEPIRLRHGGTGDDGGVPPQESQDALSVLARILGKPIKLFYTQTSDGPLMVMEFYSYP